VSFGKNYNNPVKTKIFTSNYLNFTDTSFEKVLLPPNDKIGRKCPSEMNQLKICLTKALIFGLLKT